MSALVLHAGAHAATLEQVAAVQTPDATQTWQPIPHVALIDLVRTSLHQYGLTVVNESYGLWRDGQRLFGVMELRNGAQQPDYALTIGLRNSHDMSFPAAGAIGSRVFVCDNMAFSGEVSFARKHTSRIMEHLPRLTERAIGRLIELRGRQDARIAAYKKFDLTDPRDVHDFIIRALKRRVIPTALVDDVLAQWEQPNHAEFAPRTAWSLFNGFTEALKGAPSLLTQRTMTLHAMMDQQVGLATIIEANFGDDPRGADADVEIIDPTNN